MPGIHLDTGKFPFVFIRFAPENAMDDEVRWLIGEQRKMFERRQRFVMLVDASRPTASSPVQRRMYTNWMKESEPLSERYCAGMAIVIANPVMRGALQAVLWFFTPPVPVATFGTLREAAAHTAGWMRAEQMPNSLAAERLADPS